MKVVTSVKIIFVMLFVISCGRKYDFFIEAESFSTPGTWVVDQQGMDVRGSSWLLAHGAGVPVEDASEWISLPGQGRYYVFALTRNWTAPWSPQDGPGAFRIMIDGRPLKNILGIKGEAWSWQYAGCFKASGDSVKLSLHDLTGFDGRCDALYLSRSRFPWIDASPEGLEKLRLRMNPQRNTPVLDKQYDFVVVGGGIAGICAAVSAARLGLKTAIVNNRPVLGGNNSAEIRVHLGGRIELDPYPNLGNLIKEFGHKKCGNADSAEKFADWKKEDILIDAGVDIYPSYHAFDVEKDGNRIDAIHCRHISRGELIRLSAPLFADCTGDGSIGFLAGADYREGRESRSEFGESMAPEKADDRHLGASLLWNSRDTGAPSSFPEFSYGLNLTDSSAVKASKFRWDWETGLDMDMIKDVEKIRDYGLLVIYSNWSYIKNHMGLYPNRALDWVAYILGKRESRRLMGDYILTENDLVDAVPHEDGTCSTSWGIDLHEPKPENEKFFPEEPFMTEARHLYFEPYPIPYRCMYSRNIENLFMAGRDISCSHVAFGSVRVIRTCGMMGEVVGMAASICQRHGSLPRSVYTDYFKELVPLMEEGAGKQGLPNDQDFCIHGCFDPAIKKPSR